MPPALSMQIGSHTVLLDASDAETLRDWTWHVIPQNANKSKFRVRGYRSGNSAVRTYMHRAILGITDKTVEIDHINGNPLDNRRSNLRVLGRHSNQHNRGKNQNNTSGFKGVTRRGSRWLAQISVSGCALFLGLYDTAEDAAKAYDAIAKEWYGADAFQNL